jgi:hypothetical protein
MERKGRTVEQSLQSFGVGRLEQQVTAGLRVDADVGIFRTELWWLQHSLTTDYGPVSEHT